MTTCDDLLNSFASAFATKKPQNASAGRAANIVTRAHATAATTTIEVRGAGAGAGAKASRFMSSLPQFLVPLVVARLGAEVHLLLDVLDLPSGEVGERLRFGLLTL